MDAQLYPQIPCAAREIFVRRSSLLDTGMVYWTFLTSTSSSTPNVKPRIRMRDSQGSSKGSSKGSSTNRSHPDPRYRRRLTRLNPGDTQPARHGRYAPSSALHVEPLRGFPRLDAAGCYGAGMAHSGIIHRTPPE